MKKKGSIETLETGDSVVPALFDDLQVRGIYFESVDGVGTFEPVRVLTVELDTTFSNESDVVDRVFIELLLARGDYAPHHRAPKPSRRLPEA